MTGADWFDRFFGEDYFEIYRDAFPEERTAAEVEGIVSLLGLGQGARVLDLACGHGRHAIALAGRGLDATGYDLSEVFLERARADAEAQGVSVRWVRGDMRRLGFDAEFDAAVRMRSLHQLLALMREAGLEPRAWYGGLDGSDLRLSSHRLVLVSAREREN